MLFVESGVVFLALAGLGLMGGFAVAPFSGRYTLLAAPLAGIAVHAVGISLLYGILKLPYVTAALITATTASVLTLLTLGSLRPRLPVLAAATVGLPTVLLSTAICANAALSLGSAAITFMDGTDHAGYAHVADWLIAHRATEHPVASINLPYQSWPELLFAIDLRFGTMAFLASVSLLRGSSGLFAYDTACAIALSAAIIAVACVLASRPTTLLLLVVGLFASHWFDYSRAGFLGKVLLYPSILMLAGLFVSGVPAEIGILVFLVLAIAIASLHSGIAAALLLGVTAGSYLLCKALIKRQWRELLPEAAVLASAGLVLIATTGVIVRPPSLVVLYPDWNVSWPYILPRIFDLENQGVTASKLSSPLMNLLLIGSIGLVVALLFLATRQRNAVVIGFVAGPAIMLAILVAGDARAIAFQLIGIFYPITLCAAARFIEDNHAGPQTIMRTALAGTIVFIAMRVPRFVGAVDRYAISAPSAMRYTSAQVDRLSRVIGSAPVAVDVETPQAALVLLLELGRRNMAVQWSKRSWDFLFAYRRWAPPVYTEPPVYLINQVGAEPLTLTALPKSLH